MRLPPAEILPAGKAKHGREPGPGRLAPLLEILSKHGGDERMPECMLFRVRVPCLVYLDDRQFAELLEVGKDGNGERAGVHSVPFVPDLLQATLLGMFLLAKHSAFPVGGDFSL